MLHSKPTTSSCGRCMHSQHNPCPTELTDCEEGIMTRERSAWWGDINEKRNSVKEVHKGGHSHAPLRTHNVLMRPVHDQHNPCPTELTSWGAGSMTRERSAWWGDINEKRNKV